jgi:hypothetical protein
VTIGPLSKVGFTVKVRAAVEVRVHCRRLKVRFTVEAMVQCRNYGPLSKQEPQTKLGSTVEGTVDPSFDSGS